MKQKIKITGVNVHDLLFEGFLMRMAFDTMLMKFFVDKFAPEKETEDGQQILTLLLEDDRDQIKYFKRLLESRDYNTDEEQLKYCKGLMEKTDSRVRITKIEYEHFDGHVPDLVMAATAHNFEMMGAFCNKEQKQ